MVEEEKVEVEVVAVEAAMHSPSVRGSSLSNMIELVGLLPGKTLCGSSDASSAPSNPPLRSSASTSAADLPCISASVCAKKLESRIGWWSPSGLCEVTGARKSAGINFVPWCISW